MPRRPRHHQVPRASTASTASPLPPSPFGWRGWGIPPRLGWPDEREMPRVPRLPRANVDPIRSATDALAVISSVMHHPLIDETIVVYLAQQRLGCHINVVADTDDVDLGLLLDRLLSTIAPAGSLAMVVATVRPDGATRPGDLDAWLEAGALVEARGIELVEWFVIGPAGPECPRDLLGEPERW
ncbi:MAG: hypothetical protein U0Q03_02790 [Acidimicrobiales bacterium]